MTSTLDVAPKADTGVLPCRHDTTLAHCELQGVAPLLTAANDQNVISCDIGAVRGRPCTFTPDSVEISRPDCQRVRAARPMDGLATDSGSGIKLSLPSVQVMSGTLHRNADVTVRCPFHCMRNMAFICRIDNVLWKSINAAALLSRVSGNSSWQASVVCINLVVN